MKSRGKRSNLEVRGEKRDRTNKNGKWKTGVKKIWKIKTEEEKLGNGS